MDSLTPHPVGASGQALGYVLLVEAGRIRASRSGTGCKLSRSVRDTYVSAARLIIPDD